MTKDTSSDGAPDMVAKRLRYIERARRHKTGTVDVRFAGMRPDGRGPTNRHGMPQLPIGQHAVKSWPVLDLGDVPRIDRADWRLEVGGACETPFTLDWDRFLGLPQVDDESDFHCVTTWSRMDNHWRGVRFAT